MRRSDETRDRVRHLRLNQTPAEARLWAHLRAGRLGGVKFSRQVLAGPFILDFAVRLQKLAIEIDGDTHGGQVEYDARRSHYPAERGYRVIRFTNRDVMDNVEGVLAAIGDALAGPTPSLPTPLPIGERAL